MSRHYFTFGMGQKHAGKYVVIEADNGDIARHKMMNRYGRNWAFQYTEERFNELVANGELGHYVPLVELREEPVQQVKPLPAVLKKLPMIITPEQAHSIIETREPLGKFIHPENGVYVGIDNETGEAWTEEFVEFKDALKWHAQN